MHDRPNENSHLNRRPIQGIATLPRLEITAPSADTRPVRQPATANVPITAPMRHEQDHDSADDVSHVGHHVGALLENLVDHTAGVEPPDLARKKTRQDTPRPAPEAKAATSEVVVTRETKADRPANDQGSDKPPIDPPPPRSLSLPGEDPERENRHDAIGQVLSASEALPRVNLSAKASFDGQYHTVINGDDPHHPTVNRSLETITRGAPLHQLDTPTAGPFASREYYSNSDQATGELPTVMVKTTNFFSGTQADIYDGAREVWLAPLIRGVVRSPEAQHAARELGYDRLDYAAPTCAITDMESGAQTVVYRWHPGMEKAPATQSQTITDTPPASDPRLTALATNLEVLFAQQGINASGLNAAGFFVHTDEHGGNVVVLSNAERFETAIENITFANPQHTIAFRRQRWESPQLPDNRDTLARPGDIIIGTTLGEVGGPILTGSTSVGRLVMLWDPRSRQGACINISGTSRSTVEGEASILRTLSAVPTMARPDVAVYIFGPGTDSAMGALATLWTERLTATLQEKGLQNITVVPNNNEIEASLDVASGQVVSRTTNRRSVVYTNTPPAESQQMVAPPPRPSPQKTAPRTPPKPRAAIPHASVRNNPAPELPRDTSQSSYEDIVTYINAQRAAAGITVASLAETTGIPSGTLKGYLTGQQYLATSRLRQVLEVVGVPEDVRGAIIERHDSVLLARQQDKTRYQSRGIAPPQGEEGSLIGQAMVLRTHNKLTNKDVAERSGVGLGTVKNFFNQQPTTPENLTRILAALGASPEQVAELVALNDRERRAAKVASVAVQAEAATLGQRAKERRTRLGLTARELARQANLPESTVSNFFADRLVSAEKVRAILAALGMSPAEIEAEIHNRGAEE